MPVDLVLNSHRFLYDIAPAVQLAETEPDDAPIDPMEYELFNTITEGGHRIIITDRILRNEYEREAGKLNLTFQVPTIVDRLKSAGLSNTPRVPRITIPFLQSQHNVLLEDAVAANAQYFVTNNPVWCNLDRDMNRSYGVRVVTPSRFIRELRRRSQQTRHHSSC